MKKTHITEFISSTTSNVNEDVLMLLLRMGISTFGFRTTVTSNREPDNGGNENRSTSEQLTSFLWKIGVIMLVKSETGGNPGVKERNPPTNVW
ncbi:hypothetical protein WICPIJ_008950 [Wickerhamomyces pijperi]|uniref:Uncharacterized protein n=1 Tax=Wickerhamomyces pijperi TaxID=599730 RepID=A0A9P8PTY8_WICPI|nr:hypothetical protein WICPIJ_008950 [Wickerhamomyces pijperi]